LSALPDVAALTAALIRCKSVTPEDGGAALGSKLVMDIPTPKTPTTSDKKRGDFRELIQEVRRQGFDPAYLQHVKEFDLRH